MVSTTTSATETPLSAAPSGSAVGPFLRRASAFVLVGLVLYAGVYAASERLVARYAHRNRFFAVKTAPYAAYDYVILGASHAAAFDYQDMNARLEQMTGARILNLSVVGGGITINRLLLDYFLVAHRTAAVLYVVDSFAFSSRAWNEDRLQDARLFYRAPFDPALARLLLQEPARRAVALDYITGFSKINNADRFKPDVGDEEARFTRTYHRVQQIDEERIEYLYPPSSDRAAERPRYLAELDALVAAVQARGIRFQAIKPPIPARVYRMLPDEAAFDAVLTTVLARRGVTLDDFSLVDNGEAFFFDTDHLNRAGVLSFFEHHLKGVLTAAAAR